MFKIPAYLFCFYFFHLSYITIARSMSKHIILKIKLIRFRARDF